jgi:hypothetical protein
MIAARREWALDQGRVHPEYLPFRPSNEHREGFA